MRLMRSNPKPRVSTSADRRRPVVLAVQPGLAYQLTRAEAHALADQLHDHAERNTDV